MMVSCWSRERDGFVWSRRIQLPVLCWDMGFDVLLVILELSDEFEVVSAIVKPS